MDAKKGFVAHWKLDGNCSDSVGALHGENNGVGFQKDSDGLSKVAVFNGIDSYITVPDNPKLSFGEDDC